MNDIGKLIADYRQRFKHGVPSYALRDWPRDKLEKTLNSSLKNNTPVLEWAAYERDSSKNPLIKTQV